jgi:hypothetical protein
MTTGFVLEAKQPASILRITWRGEEKWRVELAGPGLRAEREVYAYAPLGDFRALFEGMARDWRGWQGERSWTSLEGELHLGCTHDGLGHIAIRVELETENRGPSDWKAVGTIRVEAGVLDALAAAARSFFD